MRSSVMILAVAGAIASGCKDHQVPAMTAAEKNNEKLRQQFMRDAQLHVHFDGESMKLPIRRPPGMSSWPSYVLPDGSRPVFELTDAVGNPHPDADDVIFVLGDWGSLYGIIHAYDAAGNLEEDRSVRLEELVEHGSISMGERFDTSKLPQRKRLTLVSKTNHDVYRAMPFLLSSFMYFPQEFPGLIDWKVSTPSEADEHYELEMSFQSPNDRPLGEDGDYLQWMQVAPVFCADTVWPGDPKRMFEMSYPMHPGKAGVRNDEPNHAEMHDITSSLRVDDGRAVITMRFLVNLKVDDPLLGFWITTVDQRDEENRVLDVIIPVPTRSGTLVSTDLADDPRAEAYFNSPNYEPPRFHPATRTEEGWVVQIDSDS